MARADLNDLEHLRDAVFFDGPDKGQRLSRFWLLLTLAAVIAAAGVVGDSTATVIGAMIVAPLMTPILGTMLAVVLADRSNFAAVHRPGRRRRAGRRRHRLPGGTARRTGRRRGQQLPGRGPGPPPVDRPPGGVATGAVGSVALLRRDISDTLPGVAIAISLVPPLSVVGSDARGGRFGQAAGALLLFATNVAAILSVGVVVMVGYGVHRLAGGTSQQGARGLDRRKALMSIAALAVAVVAALSYSTATIVNDRTREATVERVAEEWGADKGWTVVGLDTRAGKTIIRFEGPLPIPDTDSLRTSLEAAGIDTASVEADLLPRSTVDFGASPDS